MAADWLLPVATIAKEKQEELPQPSQAKNEEVLMKCLNLLTSNQP